MALTKEDLQAIGELIQQSEKRMITRIEDAFEISNDMLKDTEKRMITRIEDAFEISNDMLKDTEKRINIRMDDGFARVDGKLAGLQQGQTGLRADLEKGFKEIGETITEVVDVIDSKIERLETTA